MQGKSNLEVEKVPSFWPTYQFHCKILNTYNKIASEQKLDILVEVNHWILPVPQTCPCKICICFQELCM